MPSAIAACVSVGMVLAIGASSALGVSSSPSDESTPGAKLRADCLSGLSAGVLLAVAWLHLLDDAQERLEGLTDYPAANLAMLAGFLLMSAVTAPAPCNHSSSAQALLPSDVPKRCAADQQQQTHFHVVEASISVHSILIGLGFGLGHANPEEQLVLGTALCVHQFLEGLALGMLGRRSGLGARALRCTFLVFTLSLPLGAAAAVAVRYACAGVSDSRSFLWLTGLLNAFAAGTLTHIGVAMISSMGHDARPNLAGGAAALPHLGSATSEHCVADCCPAAAEPALPDRLRGAHERALRTMLGETERSESANASSPLEGRCSPKVLQLLSVGLGATLMSVLAIWA